MTTKMVASVRTERMSSKVKLRAVCQVQGPVGPIRAERPRARRKSWSMCSRAAVVAGEVVGAVEEVRDVPVEGNGGGMWMATNMWYVCMTARMKRQASGKTGRPSRRVRFSSEK